MNQPTPQTLTRTDRRRKRRGETVTEVTMRAGHEGPQYYAIVHPLSAMKFNSKSRTKKILVATWAIPVVLASPYTFSTSFPFVITSSLGSISRQICNDRFDEIDAAMYGPGTTDRFRRGFFIFLFLVIYLLPMLVILATCVRITLSLLQPIAVRRWPSATGGKDSGRRHEENKRKVARMVIVVAVAFIVSWSPFYLTTLVSQIQSINGDSFLREGNFVFSMLMIHLCGFLNSCINPLIYTGMSQKFRRSFKMILSGCICCRLTYRFLRYRDSITRGGAFTSTMCQSMTEVHDSNDMALSEAGSSSGDRPPFLHHPSRLHHQHPPHFLSSSPCRRSPRSPERGDAGCGGGGGGGSFRQAPQLRRPGSTNNTATSPVRPLYNNLSQGQTGDPRPQPRQSPDTTTTTATTRRSRSFKLWKTSPESREVVIQLTTLQCQNDKANRTTTAAAVGEEGGDVAISERGQETAGPRVVTSSCQEGRPGSHFGGEGQGPWLREDLGEAGIITTTTTTTKPLSKTAPADQATGPLKETPDLSDPLHPSCCSDAGASSGRSETAQKIPAYCQYVSLTAGDPNPRLSSSEDVRLFGVYRPPEGSEGQQNQGCSSRSLTRGAAGELDTIPMKAIEEWKGVVMKGDSPNKLRKAIFEWTESSPEFAPHTKLPPSSQRPQSQVTPVSVCSTNQHGALVHVGLSTNGQCVQL